MPTSDSAERMLAARQEVIERLLNSMEAHGLNDGELVATGIFGTAEALIEATDVSRQSAGAALEGAVRAYLAYADASTK